MTTPATAPRTRRHIGVNLKFTSTQAEWDYACDSDSEFIIPVSFGDGSHAIIYRLPGSATHVTFSHPVTPADAEFLQYVVRTVMGKREGWTLLRILRMLANFQSA